MDRSSNQRRSVQRRAAGGAGADLEPGKATLTRGLRAGSQTPVQLAGAPDRDADSVHALAAAGMSGAGGALPHHDAIQRSFGSHDIGGVVAHVGGAATSAAAGMNALAYASGGQVAFAQEPDLHLAAHEAAHVVQQRAGVQLSGGVGQSGDPYERHADAVADRVVRGESAETLLSEMAGPSGAAQAAVQRVDGPMSQQPEPQTCSPDLSREIERGIELAVYTTFSGFTDQGTFESAAIRFAADHRAIGLVNGALVIGAEAAMGAGSPDAIIQHVQQTIAAIRRQVRRQDVGIGTLALFCHGLNDRLNWARGDGSITRGATRGTRAAPLPPGSCGSGPGGQTGGTSEPAQTGGMSEPAQSGGPQSGGGQTGGTYTPDANPDISAHDFAQALNAALTGTARVVLYACTSGQAAGSTETDAATGGEDSFGDELRDELTAGGEDREVWAHRTTAHTTGNPTWRNFDGPQAEGERASEDLFGAGGNLASEQTRAALARQIASQLGLQIRFHRPARAHQLMRGRRVLDAEFGRWVAREMPFIPEELREHLVRGADRTIDQALVDWFVTRYQSQCGDRLQ